ncbi:MAG: glycosyltransferase family 2 protein [Pyrinomonadaceae bacterium]
MESNSLLTRELTKKMDGNNSNETINIELSVVMPCLDESDTLAICIEKAQRAISENNISGEIVVADNGSTDASPEIARGLGARVVNVKEKGYGSALMGGISAARGKFVIMGDADDSYDFLEIPKFVAKLREGYDLVQGLQIAERRRHDSARSHAFSASLVGKSNVFRVGSKLVLCSDTRCLLRNARFYQNSLRIAQPAMYGNGICDRDDYQIKFV